MNCPQCMSTLVTLEFDRIEIDYCPDCMGIWLDQGELDVLASEEGAGDSLLQAKKPAVSGEKPRKCPICTRGMKKIMIGDDEPVLLDECTRHGFWFDRGELRKVLSGRARADYASKETSRIVQLLDEIFAPRD